MIRVVFDTNVLVSGLLFEGRTRQLLRLAAGGQLLLFTSKPIFLEVAEVLARPKFRLSLAEQAAALGVLRSLCEFVEPTEGVVFVKADPDDDKILECALEVGVDYVVSGDHHLLDLKEFNAIPIVSASRLLDILGIG